VSAVQLAPAPAPADNVVPLRPFTNALEQVQKMGRPDLRPDTIALVREHLRLGFDGYGVARQLQAERLRHQPRPQGGAA
jgi:hypothetical protein